VTQGFPQIEYPWIEYSVRVSTKRELRSDIYAQRRVITEEIVTSRESRIDLETVGEALRKIIADFARVLSSLSAHVTRFYTTLISRIYLGSRVFARSVTIGIFLAQVHYVLIYLSEQPLYHILRYVLRAHIQEFQSPMVLNLGASVYMGNAWNDKIWMDASYNVSIYGMGERKSPYICLA